MSVATVGFTPYAVANPGAFLILAVAYFALNELVAKDVPSTATVSGPPPGWYRDAWGRPFYWAGP